MIYRAYVALVRFACSVAFRLNIWRGLSAAWRLATMQHRYYPVKIHVNVPHLTETLGAAKWEADTKRLGDSISWPGECQWRIDHNEPLGDCDDFAMYACAVLKQMDFSCIRIMAVVYLVGWKVRAHAVAIFMGSNSRDDRRLSFGWYHIGNWMGGIHQGPFMYAELCKAVAWLDNGRPIYGARIHPDTLKTEDYGPIKDSQFYP